MNTTRESIGGLSHLVEAVTVLTKLNGAGIQGSPVLNEPITATRNDRSIVSDDDDESRRLTKQSSSRYQREIFPQRLLSILKDTSLSNVISWLPHGRSFVIIRPDVFSDTILPTFFSSTDSKSSTKYPSFTRKLNRWGFRQATRGSDTGAFHHPLFQRDHPELCLSMTCQKSRKRSSENNSKVKEPSTKQEANQLPQASSPDGGTSPAPKPEKGQTNELSTVPTISFQPIAVTQSTAAGMLSATCAHSPTMPPTHAVQNPTLSPWVPTDPKLVETTLRAHAQLERINAAKAMLYDAYMKALQGK